MAKNETIIRVENLRKVFATKQKKSGLSGSMHSLLKPKTIDSVAVDNISFEVNRGEILGFLGPNGAGKSTTIKMLVGILFPTSGQADVLGYTPWKQRQKLAMKIGSVFGQKPQLWYHLPPIDTFNLMSKIYEMDEKEYKKRLNYLVDRFEIDYLNTPVRRLSLGQRMRAEVVASLLHKPEIIFLDEPTIGLDIIAKQKIRDLILELNKKENVTVFLTSHDMDDVEKLCNRIIVINHGKMVFNNTLSKLKSTYVTSKNVEVKFEKSPKKFTFSGARVLKRSSYDMTIHLDQKKRDIKDLVDYLTSNFEVLDINIADPTVEEIIAKIYKK
ncbi:MAG: ATP-binding cassette domain-containing protein [Candidatus Micrarchaeaceae archaeon]|jgi:ABC-2 type transport system ATP-binding protein